MAIPVTFCGQRALCAQPDTGEETEEGSGDGGDGAEKTFGVAGALVKVGGGEDLAVEPCGEIGVAVEEGDVVGGDAVSGDGDEAHQDPIADEGGDCQGYFVCASRG